MIEKIKNLLRYRFLLGQLVKRDFKVKYRGSILGILWSVLNPLLNMIVLSIVFSKVFRAVDNYKMYLLSGITIFNFISEATNLACTSVVSNFGLVSKVYFPKLIIPTSKVLTSGINLLITTGVYLILGAFMNLPIWWGNIMIIFVLFCVLLFSLGFGYILSTLFVFFRDTLHIYGVLLTVWMYSTPILYPIESLPENLIPFFKLNPIYHFINTFREITMYRTIPSANELLICLAYGVVVFIIGSLTFVKNQDKFIYYE